LADTWTLACTTGATDNAAGCSFYDGSYTVLKASGFKPKRTIRICLWGGEEQGLHGSEIMYAIIYR
jgi:Zn-dependent M28 family amino/carboxypeptidase